MKLIQKNPVTMVGLLSRCWLFTFSTPADEARRYLPSSLEPVLFGQHAFWNVVVCQIKNMRPKLFPLPVGVSYWHVAYRLYVRLHSQSKNPIEGLYFLRSDCDNMLMSLAGNVLTDFNFHTGTVWISQDRQFKEITIAAPGGDAFAKLDTLAEPRLSSSSPFGSLEEAYQFLKYKPNGISIDTNNRANVVHIVRDDNCWKSRLVQVEQASWSFFDDKNVNFEICYEVEPISYQWNRADIVEPEIGAVRPVTPK